jgi:hypothetical protein
VKEPGDTHGWRWPHKMKFMVVVWTCDDIKLQTWKRRKRKIKWAKGDINRAISFTVIKTL